MNKLCVVPLLVLAMSCVARAQDELQPSPKELDLGAESQTNGTGSNIAAIVFSNSGGAPAAAYPVSSRFPSRFWTPVPPRFVSAKSPAFAASGASEFVAGNSAALSTSTESALIFAGNLAWVSRYCGSAPRFSTPRELEQTPRLRISPTSGSV